jgi:hypothetical protein
MVLTLIASRGVFILLWLVTACLAVARWDRHPLTSLWASVASALGLLGTVAGALFPLVMRSVVGEGAVLRFSFLTGLISATALGCLIVAVFAERRPG